MTKVRLDATPDTTNNQVLVITTKPNLGAEFMLNNGTAWTEITGANNSEKTGTKRTEIAKGIPISTSCHFPMSSSRPKMEEWYFYILQLEDARAFW